MLRLTAFALLLCACGPGWAQDVSRLYSNSDLEKSASLYGGNLRGMWDEDFLAMLTVEERRKAGQVSLFLPLIGANRHPIDFYSDVARRKVFLPIASVKFIDDLGIAFAYYERTGCGQGLVSDYAAVLRLRPEQANGPPLETLGVPSDALADPFVDDVSQKILKSTVYFVAAHEYAHVMYRHKGYGTITAGEAQAQEMEADAFALDVMRRIGVAPMAMTYFFLVASRLEPSPGEFSSTAEYEKHLRQRTTHPVSASRIRKVADGIDASIDAFTQLQANPGAAKKSLQWIVPQLREIARTLDDPKMRDFLAHQARTLDVSKLALACRRK